MRCTFRLALLLAIVALPTSLLAQPMPPGAPPEEAPQKTTRIGVKAGLNSATLSASSNGESFPYERMISFAAGGVAVMAINDRMSLQGEALYIRKGADMDLSDLGGGSGTVTLDYIEIPVLGRADFGAGTGTKPFVYGGAALAVFMSAGLEIDGESQEIDEDTISKLDVALQIGGGVEIPMSSGAVTLEARYSHGLLNADDSPDSTVEVYNRVLSFFGGFLF